VSDAARLPESGPSPGDAAGAAGADRGARPPMADAARVDGREVPGLPCDAEGPVFAEPWQAQAFALTVALHQRGLFEWGEWAQYLSRAIRDAQGGGDPDLGDTYYRHWLAALERLLLDKGVAAPLALAGLREAWRTAAEATPHGQPVRLNSAARRLGRAAAD
jgi:nitrile hydratase accessory protein